MGRSSVADILITRDRISNNEAMDRVNHCCERLENEAIPTGDHDLAEEIIAEELGLESDYLIDLI